MPSLRKGFVLFLILCSPIILCFKVADASTIPLVEWEDLSDKDVSPQAKLAVTQEKELWRHAETDHFIYHFKDPKEAETIYIHAEIYYQWVKELFQVTEDSWKKKAHIFVFEDEKVWQAFNSKAGPVLEGDAFTTGWELFIYRNPFWLAPKKTLAHEITHVIVFRFLDGPIPMFLNEGFAEFVSTRAVSTQFGGNEYDVRTLKLLEQSEYISLEELTTLRSYPEGRIKTFYRESELLVRFLIVNFDKGNFYLLLRAVSKGKPFREALEEIYHLDLAGLEEPFKTYAIATQGASS